MKRVHHSNIHRPSSAQASGFTLLELLVVIAVIAIISTLVVPAVFRGLSAAKEAKCMSNLHGLHNANFVYATDMGSFAPAAADILSSGNSQRWHGARSGSSGNFDAKLGPLADILGPAATLRDCPTFKPTPDPNAFEASCGGYGYNVRGVGSQMYVHGYNDEAMQVGMEPDGIANPQRTVMFSDTAFGQPYGSPDHLIEYSFAEAYRFVDGYGRPSSQATPSIHFRHRDKALVIWCAGQVSRERLEVEASADHTKLNIGWFGPADNSLFDPF